MGRSATPLPMDTGQRAALVRIVGSRRAATRQVRRARALLLAASGWSNVRVARLCEVSPLTVGHWRARFERCGVASVLHPSTARMPSVDSSFVPHGDQFLGGLYLGPIERVAVWTDEAATPARHVFTDHRAHNHHDLLRFLRAVELYTPDELDVHLLLADCSSYLRHEVHLWLSNARHRRFRLSESDPARWCELTRPWARAAGAAVAAPYDTAGAAVAAPYDTAGAPRAPGQWVLRPATADRGRWRATGPPAVER